MQGLLAAAVDDSLGDFRLGGAPGSDDQGDGCGVPGEVRPDPVVGAAGGMSLLGRRRSAVLHSDLPLLPGSGSPLLGWRPSLRREGEGGVVGGLLRAGGREGDRGLLQGGLPGGFSPSSFFFFFSVDRDVLWHQCVGAGSPHGRAGFALLRPRQGRSEHVEGLTGVGQAASGSVGCERGGGKRLEKLAQRHFSVKDARER